MFFGEIMPKYLWGPVFIECIYIVSGVAQWKNVVGLWPANFS